ncbi:unnamed protein product [Pylaiella littoralis]
MTNRRKAAAMGVRENAWCYAVKRAKQLQADLHPMEAIKKGVYWFWPRAKRRDATSEELMELMRQYWHDDEVSRATGNSGDRDTWKESKSPTNRLPPPSATAHRTWWGRRGVRKVSQVGAPQELQVETGGRLCRPWSHTVHIYAVQVSDYPGHTSRVRARSTRSKCCRSRRWATPTWPAMENASAAGAAWTAAEDGQRGFEAPVHFLRCARLSNDELVCRRRKMTSGVWGENRSAALSSALSVGSGGFREPQHARAARRIIRGAAGCT